MPLDFRNTLRHINTRGSAPLLQRLMMRLSRRFFPSDMAPAHHPPPPGDAFLAAEASTASLTGGCRSRVRRSYEAGRDYAVVSGILLLAQSMPHCPTPASRHARRSADLPQWMRVRGGPQLLRAVRHGQHFPGHRV
jgi:hypothetical protein